MIVYLVRNWANGKAYVGKTKRSFPQRWREHVRNTQVNKDEMSPYFATRKHGLESFDHLSVLQECTSEAKLNRADVEWIEAFGSFSKGYSAPRGGDGISGYRHADGTKKGMSETRRGKKLGPRSEEIKFRISESRKGLGTGP